MIRKKFWKWRKGAFCACVALMASTTLLSGCSFRVGNTRITVGEKNKQDSQKTEKDTKEQKESTKDDSKETQDDVQPTDDAEATADDAQDVSDETDVSYTAGSSVSEDLSDLEFMFDGMNYSCCYTPMDAVLTDGWKFNDSDMKEKLEASDIGFFSGEKPEYGEYTNYYFKPINLGESDCSVADAMVYGVSVDVSNAMEQGEPYPELVAPKGITFGSSEQDVLDAYGNPDQTYEGDLYDMYEYYIDDTGYNGYYSFYVYKDDNTVKQIEIQGYAVEYRQ